MGSKSVTYRLCLSFFSFFKSQAEELGIVIFVLMLWAAAIALFINRWGKIREMEPYHPYIQGTATDLENN